MNKRRRKKAWKKQKRLGDYWIEMAHDLTDPGPLGEVSRRTFTQMKEAIDQEFMRAFMLDTLREFMIPLDFHAGELDSPNSKVYFKTSK